MPRQLRLQYPGACYHVMARGNRRDAIFKDETDRRFFLGALGEVCARAGWHVWAWVLMGNHYHAMIETPEANLVSGMQWLQNAYTRRFNTRHGLWGRLFGDRYKAMPVEGRQGEYAAALVDYIHLNPVRAGLVRPGQQESVRDYPWSSVAGGYALPAGKRAPWLAAEAGLALYGLADDTAGRRRFVERLDARAAAESRARCGVPPEPEDGRASHLRRGWYWGSQGFQEKLLALADGLLGRTKSRSSRRGALQQAHGEHRAEELVRAGLEASGLTAADLEGLPGTDPRKVLIAAAVREQTAVSLGWIAERLSMRSAANVSQILRRDRAERAPKKPKSRN